MTDTELSALQDELAEVARSIARLLLKPGHDPAELAALDARARKLRARIRAVQEQEALRATVLRFPGNGRPPMPEP
ncbi:MAG TPA: hypothetical protein VFJ82_20345 [Longimicrobium sp.]|nr:hypothetical protein [Longimicrobium sp.]